MFATVADEQIVRGTAATISFQYRNQHGDAAAPAGTPTVSVTRSNGDAVTTGAVSGSSTEPRTATVAIAETATVDRLTASWSDGGVVVGQTIVDIIGVPLISADEFQAREPRATYDEAKFRRARREVDDLFRRVCQRSFVPRFEVEYIDRRSQYSQRLALRYPHLERVAWAEDEDGVAISGATTVPRNASGIAVLDDYYWPAGERIVIGYEHGFRRPPDDVVGAAARCIRDRLTQGNSAIPDRATSYTDPSGGQINLATPGLGPFTTGIPEVDEVLEAYRWATPAVA